MATSIGPYKSRFFNFINRQVIRFQDKVGKTIRSLKVATKWGVQILLYPIYLVVQTGRMVGHKLKAAPRLESEEQQPTDQPIERVLKGIEPWCLLDNIPQNRGIVKIQGVANLLETGALVLVSTDNETLDILNPEQQGRLHKSIIREIAHELYRELSLGTATLFDSSPVRELPKIETKPSTVFPIGLFWQIMAWVERGSVAIAIDLFQESTLVPNIIPNPNQITDLDTQIRRELVGFHGELNPHRNAQNTLLSLIRAAIDYFFGKRNETISSGGAKIPPSSQKQELSGVDTLSLPPSDPWLTQEDILAVRESGLITKSSEENHLAVKGKLLKTAPSLRDRIKTLIYAAIDYFFNKRRVKGIPGKEEQGKLRLGNEDTSNKLPAAKEVDSWLSWPDLFGEAAPTVGAQGRAPVQSAESSLLSTTTSQVSPSLIKLDSVEAVDSIASEDIREETESNSWVETEATPMGYSQHFLEKILAWFDRGILFLEERALRIWRWLSRLGR